MPEQGIILMTLAVAGFVVLLGAWGFMAPRSIIGFIESWSSQGGLWLAVLLRLAFAGVLWLAAPLSKTPFVFQLLALLAALAAVTLPLFGYTWFKRFIEWWSRLPASALRLWCLVAVALGVFVFWSAARPITISIPEQPIEIRDTDG